MKKFIRNGLIGAGLVGIGLATAYVLKVIKEVDDVDLDEEDEEDDFFSDEEDCEDIAAEWDSLLDDDLTRDEAILGILNQTSDYTTESLAELTDAEIFDLYKTLNI